MNKLQMPSELPAKIRRLPIQAIESERDCIVAAVDTLDQQQDLRQFDDVMGRLGEID